MVQPWRQLLIFIPSACVLLAPVAVPTGCLPAYPPLGHLIQSHRTPPGNTPYTHARNGLPPPTRQSTMGMQLRKSKLAARCVSACASMFVALEVDMYVPSSQGNNAEEEEQRRTTDWHHGRSVVANNETQRYTCCRAYILPVVRPTLLLFILFHLVRLARPSTTTRPCRPQIIFWEPLFPRSGENRAYD